MKYVQVSQYIALFGHIDEEIYNFVEDIFSDVCHNNVLFDRRHHPSAHLIAVTTYLSHFIAVATHLSHLIAVTTYMSHSEKVQSGPNSVP